jgi:hypothetical protein
MRLRGIKVGMEVVSIENLADENLLRLYESIREQVAHDLRLGGRYKFMGETARLRAQTLREEIDHRHLQVQPIYWG